MQHIETLARLVTFLLLTALLLALVLLGSAHAVTPIGPPLATPLANGYLATRFSIALDHSRAA